MTQPQLSAALLARLRPFVAPADRGGEFLHADHLFSYCALHRERLLAVVPEDPLLGVVLRGMKEVWHGERGHVLRPGTVFVLPRGLPLDIVNIPDAQSGVYETLVLRVPDLPPAIRPRPAPRQIPRFEVSLTPDLVEALAHAATAIADRAHGALLGRLRLTELLLLLADDPAGQMLACGDLVARARWIIAARPDHGWTVAELGRELGLGASTLRRKLGEAGHPFRSLLAETRMASAQEALQAGASVAVAASASGYQSRSRFARAYRASHGVTPRHDRRRA